MLISGRDFSDEILARIRTRVADDPSLTRTALSREVCSWIGWQGADGRPKDMSCRVALLKLSRRGQIELPAQRQVSFSRPAGTTPPTSSSAPTPASTSAAQSWLSLNTTLAELGRVQLIPVDSGHTEHSRLWWAMMRAHHPLGAGPLCGAQLRYLVTCEAGVIGGLSFSAPAWRLAARDTLIGWDDASRQAGLTKIVANSRFLILPEVRVPNLASHVLSRALARLANDWQTRYGITPVLIETFVDRSRYRGTCYKAANWKLLGQTKGRGRQDRQHLAATSQKDVWVYPLRSNWQTILRATNTTGAPGATSASSTLSRHARPPTNPPLDWAEQEFGHCDLPDERLQTRLLTIARDFYARPSANITQACASRAKVKAAYRFLDHDKVKMGTLLQPHYRATEARARKEKIVLAIQDSTSLNYSSHAATEGIGSIGTKLDGPQGLHLHSTLALNVNGTSLGFLDAQCWARDPEKFGKKALRHSLPIEEKESIKWLNSYRAVAAVQARCPNTMLVSVGDREADIYELFVDAAAHVDGPKLLVRAKHNRKLKAEQRRLWETMQSRPVDGCRVLKVPRQGNRAARKARMTIRYAAVELLAPKGHQGPPLSVWAVLAQELDAPAGVKSLEWMLLTTVAVPALEDACERLEWYALRWGIEVFHRTLKSGCRIEQRQLAHADRIEACLAIDMVVAWRIYHLNKLARETPDVPCTVCLTDDEWKALAVFTTKNPVVPEQPPTLRAAIRSIAGLGGFLGRKGDGEPGTQTLWLGLTRLSDIATTWAVLTDATQYSVSGRRYSG